MTVNYAYYRGEYCGKMSEEDFDRVSRAAEQCVMRAVSGREIPHKFESLASDAICAVSDLLLQDEQGGAIASTSNDGISETYAVDSRTKGQRITGVIENYLGDTGLLCRWV